MTDLTAYETLGPFYGNEYIDLPGIPVEAFDEFFSRDPGDPGQHPNINFFEVFSEPHNFKRIDTWSEEILTKLKLYIDTSQLHKGDLNLLTTLYADEFDCRHKIITWVLEGFADSARRVADATPTPWGVVDRQGIYNRCTGLTHYVNYLCNKYHLTDSQCIIAFRVVRCLCNDYGCHPDINVLPVELTWSFICDLSDILGLWYRHPFPPPSLHA